MRVLIAGGGTASHVFPALAVARRLVGGHGAAVTFAGTASGPESRLVPAAGLPFEPIEARPLRRGLSLETVTAPIAAVRSISACRPLVERADVVVGMGAYVSVPVGLAAARARRPLVIHEQDAVPGLANRLLARWAHTVTLAFEDSAARLPGRVRTVLTGDPVRDEILTVVADREALADRAFIEFGLEPGRRTLFVFGGSQGALRLNTAALELIARLRDRADLQVLLLTGPAHEQPVADRLPSGDVRVHVRGYLDRMELAYAIADLVISRAGANTCAELSICGLPAVLVPYPHATGHHQEANARALERAGGARVIMDADLTDTLLATTVSELLDEEERLRSMGRSMRSRSRPDAAEALARVVLEAGGRR